MPFGWVDDRHYRHQKLLELDEGLRKGCIALFWLAISWCNDQLTDGRVPTGTVRLLGGDLTEAEELVRVRLWERDGKAYRVHDYLDFNKSRDQVMADRAVRHDLAVAGGLARAATAMRVGGRFTSGTAGDTAGPSAGAAAGNTAGGTTSRTTSRGPAPVPGTRSPYTDGRDPVSEKVPARDRGTWPDDVPDDFRYAWHQRGFRLPPTTDQLGAIRMKPLTWDVAADLVTRAPARAKASQVVSYVLDGLTAGLAAERLEEAREAVNKVPGQRGGGPTKAGDILAAIGPNGGPR
jgi:hypothetical protein